MELAPAASAGAVAVPRFGNGLVPASGAACLLGSSPPGPSVEVERVLELMENFSVSKAVGHSISFSQPLEKMEKYILAEWLMVHIVWM